MMRSPMPRAARNRLYPLSSFARLPFCVNILDTLSYCKFGFEKIVFFQNQALCAGQTDSLVCAADYERPFASFEQFRACAFFAKIYSTHWAIANLVLKTLYFLQNQALCAGQTDSLVYAAGYEEPFASVEQFRASAFLSNGADVCAISAVVDGDSKEEMERHSASLFSLKGNSSCWYRRRFFFGRVYRNTSPFVCSGSW